MSLLVCDIFRPVRSITEIITIMGFCISDNLNYSAIICALLITILTLIFGIKNMYKQVI